MKIDGDKEMESLVGIELYYTKEPGVGGRLKKYPEDFVVDEIIDLPEIDEDGDHTIAKIWSSNWETNRLMEALARELNISRDHIGFAGTKDKRALTTQWMSFKVDKEKFGQVFLRNVEITDMFTSRNPLYIGAHVGNTFDIMIRDMDIDNEEALERAEKIRREIKSAGGFPNWFGVQRFGTIRPITHEVGRKLITGDYEGAVKLYTAKPMEGEGDECYRARKFLDETRDYKKALGIFPNILTFERRIIAHLAAKPDDYVGALRTLPANLLKMFIHAFQSYLFNRMVSLRAKRGYPLNDAMPGDVLLPADKNGLPNVDTPVEINERNLDKASTMVKSGKAYVSAPLYGFNSRLSGGEQGDIERYVIEEEGFEKKDFVIPEIRELSSKGIRRAIFAPVSDLRCSQEAGGLRSSFSLHKGTYATTLLREFMKLPDHESHMYS